MFRTYSICLALLASIAAAGCSLFAGGQAAQQRPAPGGLAAQCTQLRPYVSTPPSDLSKEALDANLRTAFAQWDKNDDKSLGAQELEAVNDSRRAMNNGASPVRDWNGDSKVSFEEFASVSRTMFALCDRNNDQVVSTTELERNPQPPPPDREKLRPSTAPRQ
jgi:hypothetical protein